jgi:ATP-dependent RNA helicase DeaD
MKDTFAELGLGPELLKELTALGYEEPTPIQKAAIPPLLEGRDLLGQAATGTGKTAAFALPLLQRVGHTKAVPLKPAVLVLVPTRELAVQVSEAFHRYGRSLGVSVVPIYGGQEFHRQIVALKRGTHVVIATPGRALDHLRRGTLDLSGLMVVALDEADEMLDMGFAEDLELILEAAPATRQTALFSATLPPRIAAIAERHLKNPARVLIPRDKATKGSMPKVRQTAYIVPRAHKIAALGRVLDLETPTLALIFCRTRIEVDELAERLVGRGYRVEALHGGMSQTERDRVMKKTRSANVDLLVATDVAARGLDIEHISHVVNFDVPASPEAYVHRIGRTGRAGREGVAITLAEPREHRLLRNIEFATKQKVVVSTVPTPLDVKARRLDLTKGAVREVLLAGELDGFRVVVETLAAEFDPMDVAAAAVRLAHEATSGSAAQEDEVHIPVIESFARPRERPQEFAQRGPPRGGRRGDGPGRNAGDMVRIYIAAGRRANIRPADLVGAIANEAGINPRVIGDIEITDGFSLVELPEADADRVIDSLRGATLRGKKVTVRRDMGFQKTR